MKIKNKKNNKLRFILAVIIFIIISILSLLALEKFHITNFLNVSEKSPEQIKQDKIDSQNKQDFVINKNSEVNTEVIHPTSDNIKITTNRESDGSLTILTELTNYSDGTCDLTITNNDQSYTQTVPIIYQPSFSTCAGFNITTDTLGPGTWQISIIATSKGESNTKTISVEVQ